MSPDTIPTPERLERELRSYGRWLDGRTDVPLSAPGVAIADDLSDPDLLLDPVAGPDWDDEPDLSGRTRVLAALVSVTAVAVLVAVALGLTAGSGGDQITTDAADGGDVGTAADTPTSDGRSPDFPVRRDPADLVAPADGSAAPVDEANSADDDQPVDAADEPAPVSSSSTAPESVVVDEVMTPSTHSLDDPDGEVDPAAPMPEPTDDLFITPVDGIQLDMDVGHTFEVREMPGAATYSFEGVQENRKVLSFSGASPRFLLPSQLVVDGSATMAPGLMTVTVTVTDANGDVMGVDRVSVIMQRQGGAVPDRPWVTTRPTPTYG